MSLRCKSCFSARFFVAHRKLPFRTKVLFKYRGRSVVCPVLDRGPYITGRVWDLSYRAAKILGITGQGVDRVNYRVLRQGKQNNYLTK